MAVIMWSVQVFFVLHFLSLQFLNHQCDGSNPRLLDGTGEAKICLAVGVSCLVLFQVWDTDISKVRRQAQASLAGGAEKHPPRPGSRAAKVSMDQH